MATLTAAFTLEAFPCPWSTSTGIWALSSLPLSLGTLTLTFSAPAEIVSFTRPVLGAWVKVSLSPSLLPFSSPMFSRALLLVSSSLLMILLPFSSSTSHSVAGVAAFSDGPALLLVAAVHWEIGIDDALHLALGRVFSLFGRLCAVDHASPRPPVTAGVFRLSSSALGTWSHLCASALHPFSIPLPAHVGISHGTPPSSLHRWLSREVRLSAMISDLHDVLVHPLSDNFLPIRENPENSFNLPPSAFRL